ncbi:MAG: hypothetical protein H7Z43_10370, partial [Clostridia bacterium]|nr:hypothetical protein [Deltaproteobacteria bacterium]
MTSSLATDLAAHNRTRFTPTLPDESWRKQLNDAFQIALREIEWVESRRAEVRAQAEATPRDPEGFVRWFEGLKNTGRAQN